MTHHVMRWHNNANPRLRDSRDTIDEHQKRVQVLCHGLAGYMGHGLFESDLLLAARHHDDAEKVIGDMPRPAKDRFPALAAAYAKAELQVLTEMGLTWNLTVTESKMLHLCDKLDALQWARKHGVTGEEWDAVEVRLWKLAHALGPECAEWLQMQLAPERVIA